MANEQQPQGTQPQQPQQPQQQSPQQSRQQSPPPNLPQQPLQPKPSLAPVPPVPSQPVSASAQDTDPTLELLKRGEVRTMSKDISRLREQEAQGIRQRITNPEASQQAPASSLMPSMKQETPSAFLVPIKPSALSRALPRIILPLALIFGFGALGFFGYQWWTQRQKGPAPVAINPQTQTPSPEPQPVQGLNGPVPEPAPQPMPPLFQAENTIPIDSFTGTSSIQNILAQIQPGLTILEIPNLSFSDFLSFTTHAPSQLTLQQEYAFFAHKTAAGRSRLGFVVKTSSDISSAVLAWEPNMEQDFSMLTSSLDPKDRFYTKSFRQLPYKNTQLRYQTFSSQDMGIIYAVVGEYVVFATSIESAKAVIDKLPE